MQRRHADVELPQELVLAIQRVLELNPKQNDDPLDDLSNNFNPADVLNQLFPDGVYLCAFRVCFVTRVRHRGFSGALGRCSGEARAR